MKCALDKIKHTDNIEMCIRQNKAQNIESTQIILKCALDKIKHTDNIEMCIRQNKAHR